jgi:hypothetical protein
VHAIEEFQTATSRRTVTALRVRAVASIKCLGQFVRTGHEVRIAAVNGSDRFRSR